ncbi:MAG: putative 4-hydroxybenzoate polyprenyltransferase [Candidatus Methylacidiphilales bacterium]
MSYLAETAPVVPDVEQTPFLVRLGQFIRFSHTVFALPFALIAMLLAADGWPGWRIFGWILVCMVSARTAAMAFNRLADWEFDKRNPRTADRHRLVSKPVARTLILVSVALFAFACWNLNFLCLMLSPVALFLIFFYSITKRFSSFTHFFLGLALAATPMGSWAAVRGELMSPIPWLLALAVLLWVAGFDLIYSTLDAEFDRHAGLKSVPATFGVRTALALAPVLHTASAITLAVVGWMAALGWPYFIAWGLACGGLVLEHRWACTGDLGQVNRAFFQVNAFVGLALLTGVVTNLMILSG